MNNKLKQMIELLPTFIVIGIALALITGLFIMLSYVLVWGLILGGILWIGMLIKNYLFPSAAMTKNEGRIIEHQDKDDHEN